MLSVRISTELVSMYINVRFFLFSCKRFLFSRRRRASNHLTCQTSKMKLLEKIVYSFQHDVSSILDI